MADSSITEWVRILLVPFQEVENAMQQIQAARDPLTAEDDALHLLGKRVGEKWQGQTNSVYRRFVRARTLANHSNGNPEEIIEIFQLLVGDPGLVAAFINTGDAGFELRLEGVALDDVLVSQFVYRFLRKVASGGVKAILETYVSADDADMTVWGDGADVYAADGVGAGFGSDSDATVGGVTASYRD